MDYYLAFAYFLKIGPATLSKAVAFFGSIESFYHAEKKALAVVLGERLAAELVAFRAGFDFEKTTAVLKKRDIQWLTMTNGGMPLALQEIPDPPLCLFVKGDPTCLQQGPLCGIVGTRKVSSYGRQVTTFFSAELAKIGVVVVSGMALGVDSVAHTSCLDVAGKTVAVLGCGVDIMYPSANRLLYQRILSSGGCIVSELPPGSMPRPFTFVLRNRLIAGLSKGVLIVEGTLSSGSMITATYAAEQGKDVYVVPMPILSPLSAGPNSLLKQGAKLVIDPQDIAEEFGLNKEKYVSSITISLEPQEKKIIDLLLVENASIHMLLQKLHMPLHELQTHLSGLEILGHIRKNQGGEYEVVTSFRAAVSV